MTTDITDESPVEIDEYPVEVTLEGRALGPAGARRRFLIELGNIVLADAGSEACLHGYGTDDPEWVGHYALGYGDIDEDGVMS